ncbi:alkaline phosphatase PhoX [Algiphilus sp.]|uniref:alkaline phosphatase PhoX n=1 Tax=Algiphilus sp. TaxID=1872431 RepID=UPI003B52048D
MTRPPLLKRRTVLRYLFLSGGAAAAPAWLSGCNNSSSGDPATAPEPAPAPLREINLQPGPLSSIPDLGPANADGVAIPNAEGFSVRAVARTGTPPAIANNPLALYPWHTFPDGGATYARDNGGWIYASNSEFIPGGVGALVFDPPPQEDPSAPAPIVDAYPILTGTIVNCAGGKTPWGTWLSCEEYDNTNLDTDPFPDLPFGPQDLPLDIVQAGRVHECNPYGSIIDAAVKPALGLFSHEAAVVDLPNRTVYLTEDTGDGRFYRFVCNEDDVIDDGNGGERLRMESGTLQVLNIEGFEDDGYPEDVSELLTLRPVTWKDVLRPTEGQQGVRASMSNAPGTRFRGGEGMWFYELPEPLRMTPAGGSVPTQGIVFFSTKGDNRIWALDVENQLIEVVFDNEQIEPDFNDVDNVTVSPWGDLLVAEDGPLQRIMVVIPNQGARVLIQTNHPGSEITGPAFSPDGSRLYFSSQRGPNIEGVSLPENDEASGTGVTYELFIPPAFRGN